MRGGGYVRSTKGVDLPTWVRLTILSNKMNFQIIEGFVEDLSRDLARTRLPVYCAGNFLKTSFL